MVLKAAIVISIISIILLAIYGADVIAGNGNNNPGGEPTGFLPINASIRGTIFGGISSIMLIVSFFITRKEPSKGLGILITIGGALIIIGSALILGMQGSTMKERALVEFGSVIVIGIIIAILGSIKIKKAHASTIQN